MGILNLFYLEGEEYEVDDDLTPDQLSALWEYTDEWDRVECDHDFIQEGKVRRCKHCEIQFRGAMGPVMGAETRAFCDHEMDSNLNVGPCIHCGEWFVDV